MRFTPTTASSDLRIGEPGDRFEREADQIADRFASGTTLEP
jgi:hypothetical protein